MPASIQRPQHFSFNGIDVRLWIPDPTGRYDAANTKHGQRAAPYWARLWPSALALSAYIANHPELVAGKRVLELAGGLGLPGIVTAHTAANVLISDRAADAVAFARSSVALNGLLNVQCRELDWNALPPDLEADVLLLSDVNYEPAAFDALHELLLRFLRNGATILLATPQRLMAKSFIERLLPYCLAQEEEEVSGSAGSTFISIYVLGLPG